MRAQSNATFPNNAKLSAARPAYKIWGRPLARRPPPV